MLMGIWEKRLEGCIAVYVLKRRKQRGATYLCNRQYHSPRRAIPKASQKIIKVHEGMYLQRREETRGRGEEGRIRWHQKRIEGSHTSALISIKIKPGTNR